MPILQRNGRSSPLLHLQPGARPRILPSGLPVSCFLHRRAVFLDKGEDFGSLHSFSPRQTLRPCPDSRSSGEIQSLHLCPGKLLFCEESRRQGVLKEGSEVLRLVAGEEVESSVRFFAELAF